MGYLSIYKNSAWEFAWDHGIDYTEWLFVRACTNRILAIRTAINHVIVILSQAIRTRVVCEKWLTCEQLVVKRTKEYVVGWKRSFRS